ncbi:MAG TPA: hypothetical protein VLL72_03205, partial [Kiloniellales bacterium]|nr:hypothetical protein [Kiloniellales bacterium]
AEVRRFAGYIVGPSLELIGAPLELLRVEGLIEPRPAGESDESGESGESGEGPLAVTEAGRAELLRLLQSNLRAPVNDISKLIVALKMRFLHLLEPRDRRVQVEMLVEIYERQFVRLTELRASHAAGSGDLPGWLDLEIAQAQAALAWYRGLRESLA